MPYRAEPESDDSEVSLVQCHIPGEMLTTPFRVGMTDRWLSYERPVSFKLHPTETVTVAVDSISEVSLRRRSPIPRIALAIFLAIMGVMSIVLFLDHTFTALSAIVPAAMASMSVSLFVSARAGHVLTWRDGRKRHKLVQPATFSSMRRDQMTAALHEVARLLSEPRYRAECVQRARDHQRTWLGPPAPQAPGARVPCSDSGCVGIVGPNGKCGTCGRGAVG